MTNNTIELTTKSIILGIFLSVILSAANTYLGLFAGMTVSASIPAAILSMSILRFFKKSSILENNLVQTSASAGESLAAGVIFTFPALVLIGYWTNFDYIEVTKIALIGGILGALFTIPLRRTLIVEKKLLFPEGIATSKILQSRSNEKLAKIILHSSIIGATIKFFQQALKFWNSTVEYIFKINNSIFGVACDLSPALIGVGYIVGLNIGILILIGGIISWLIAIPIYTSIYPIEGNISNVAWTIWDSKIRFLGVGAMLIGGLWSVINLIKPVIKGIITSINDENNNIQSKDISMKIILFIILILLFPLFTIYNSILSNYLFTFIIIFLIIIISFIFSSIAGYMAGIVGSSNNPVSGITIATILFSALFIRFVGFESNIGMVSSILFGAIICCSSAIAGDNMQDLKTGYLLNATPWKQQVMQIIGVVSSALTITFVLNVLHTAYGIGSPTLRAPQANLMKAVVEGVFNESLPWNWIYMGIVIGLIIIILDIVQEQRKSSFRFPVLAVAVGIYLPISLSVPIFIGSIISYKVNKRSNENGILFASGLITGEAIMGILIAIPIFITGSATWWTNTFNFNIVGLLIFSYIAMKLYKVAKS